MTPKQTYIHNAAASVFNSDSPRTSPLIANSTPQAILPQAPAKPVVPMDAPQPRRAPAPMNAQVRSAQEALARVKAHQQTYGVPGAR